MAKWIIGHMGFAHLFKPSAPTEERMAVCSRVLTVFPDDPIQPWTMKCQYCQMHEKRNGTTKHDR